MLKPAAIEVTNTIEQLYELSQQAKIARAEAIQHSATAASHADNQCLSNLRLELLPFTAIYRSFAIFEDKNIDPER